MQSLYYARTTKSGKVRVYREVQQAVTAWRGTNEKRSVLREERVNELNYGEILNFPSVEQAREYVQKHYNSGVYEDS